MATRRAEPVERNSPTDLHECVAWANARMPDERRQNFEYRAIGGQLVLCPLNPAPGMKRGKAPVMDRRGQPMSVEETTELNRLLESYGATARYRPDGSRYMVDAA